MYRAGVGITVVFAAPLAGNVKVGEIRMPCSKILR